MMHRNNTFLSTLLWLLVPAALLLSGCSPNVRAAEITGSGAQRGRALFQLNPLENMPGCATCHLATPATGEGVGPPLADIASQAAALETETGLSAADFLRQSLVDPNAYLWPGYNPGAMPRYSDSLTEKDIDDLVDFLLTLE